MMKKLSYQQEIFSVPRSFDRGTQGIAMSVLSCCCCCWKKIFSLKLIELIVELIDELNGDLKENKLMN